MLIVFPLRAFIHVSQARQVLIPCLCQGVLINSWWAGQANPASPFTNMQPAEGTTITDVDTSYMVVPFVYFLNLLLSHRLDQERLNLKDKTKLVS